MIAQPLPRIVSFGEGLVDFFPTRTGVPLREVETFRRQVGGAPVNLAFGAARLGGHVAMLTKLGDDEFGHYLKNALHEAGVDTQGVALTTKARTGITFVQIGEGGERSFLFYRFLSAEQTFCAEDVDLEVIRNSSLIQSGTNLLMRPGPREATLLVLDEARRAGNLVSLDANLRLHLWPDPSVIRETVMDAIGRVDLLKVNEQEHAYLFGEMSIEDAFVKILKPMGVRAVISTEGPEGAHVVTDSISLRVPAPVIEAVDTTGAGDSFLAALLVSLSRLGQGNAASYGERLDELTMPQWRGALEIANFVASQVCTQFGAVVGVPHHDEIPWDRLEVP